jgi:hypothetical protein
VGENIHWLYIKGLITRIYREHKKLNSPKINVLGNWTKQNFFKGRNPNGQKQVKKCLPPLAVKEMQIKTTVRFHLTPVRIAIIKNTNNNKCWWGCREKGTLIHCWWECKLQSVWRLLKKLNIDLPYDPAILLLGIYPKECDSCLSQHYSQQPSYENSQDAPLPTNRWRSCGTYTQWNFTQPQRMKFCHSQVNGWNWRTSS